MATKVAPTTRSAPGRSSVARLNEARRQGATRTTAVTRARDARRQLRTRQERFAHLTRMYD